MTLPASGPLSLNDIKGEFGPVGSPANVALGDYYAGGAYVAPGVSGTYGAVPSSGAISIQNFYGTTVFTPGTVTYTSSSGVFTIPFGTTTINIEVVGGAAAGGYGSFDPILPQDYGGGGGGGGAKSVTSVAASGGGQSLNWLVGRGGDYVLGQYGVASSVDGGLITTMTAGGGTPGSSGQPTASGGAGGTASGGNVSDSTGDTGGQGDASSSGLGGNNFSQGGMGGYGGSVQGDPGAGGYVTFTWS
jgi:hypothetical protein